MKLLYQFVQIALCEASLIYYLNTLNNIIHIEVQSVYIIAMSNEYILKYWTINEIKYL